MRPELISRSEGSALDLAINYAIENYDLLEVVHYRAITADELKRFNRTKKEIKDSLGIELELANFKPRRFNHVAVAVSKNGDCYLGVAMINLSDKQYVRRKGYQLAVRRAVRAMADEPVFMNVAIKRKVPTGRALTDVVLGTLRESVEFGEIDKELAPFNPKHVPLVVV